MIYKPSSAVTGIWYFAVQPTTGLGGILGREINSTLTLDPQCLWSFLGWIGAVTHPLTGREPHSSKGGTALLRIAY